MAEKKTRLDSLSELASVEDSVRVPVRQVKPTAVGPERDDVSTHQNLVESLKRHALLPGENLTDLIVPSRSLIKLLQEAVQDQKHNVKDATEKIRLLRARNKV